MALPPHLSDIPARRQRRLPTCSGPGPVERPRGDRLELAEELIVFVREQIAHYKAPQWIAFVAELPKTATGKIQRFMLRQALQRKPAVS